MLQYLAGHLLAIKYMPLTPSIILASLYDSVTSKTRLAIRPHPNVQSRLEFCHDINRRNPVLQNHLRSLLRPSTVPTPILQAAEYNYTVQISAEIDLRMNMQNPIFFFFSCGRLDAASLPVPTADDTQPQRS